MALGASSDNATRVLQALLSFKYHLPQQNNILPQQLEELPAFLDQI
jgi:hypothetical protein